MEQRAAQSDFSMERVVPYFQPIMELANNRVWRYECLARLLTDSEQIFLPRDFLYIVEKQNSSTQLTHRIYELSRRYCQHRNMPWNINLSDADLSDDQLLNWFGDLYRQGENLFGVEISFSTIKNRIDILHSLREIAPSITITIDDVDDNNLALEEILTAGVDAIKLNGDFVQRFADTGEGRYTLIAIQQSCLLHDTKLVAGHIEDKKTCDAVLALGIMYGQGFYFSSPAPTM